jgi:hypothetical protein
MSAAMRFPSPQMRLQTSFAGVFVRYLCVTVSQNYGESIAGWRDSRGDKNMRKISTDRCLLLQKLVQPASHQRQRHVIDSSEDRVLS